MRLLVLLIIGLLSIESQSNYVESDPTGRLVPLDFEDSHTLESHESFRPIVKLNHANQNKNKLIYKSSVKSSENIESDEQIERSNHEELSFSDSEGNDNERTVNVKTCNSENSKFSSYINAENKVLKGELNYTREQDNSAETGRKSLFVDVTHDVFDTSRQSGLFEKIVYNRKYYSFYEYCEPQFTN